MEAISISSFLGDFGAGPLLKTFSLLPGETTTLHIESYRKDETARKAAESILDSASGESASDFEQTLQQEQDRKADDASSHSFTLGAEASASFGPFGSASLKSNYTTQANASREQVTKDLNNALEKHSSKASTNRSLTINTESATNTSSGTTDDTQREIANINVSRVLNFVFRQLLQEHLVVIHLVDAKIAYYSQDVLLDPSGNATSVQENYSEYSLPEFRDLAASVLAGGEVAAGDAQRKLEDLLSSITNADGDMVSLIDHVTPTRDGQSLPEERYIRVNPALTDSWKPRGDGGPTATVPGIALSRSHIVMRTDGVLVDSLLGQGDALDTYSAELQAVTLAERQIALDRERLAQSIVGNGGDAQANLFAKVFPPASPAGTTTTTTTTEGG